MKSFLKLIPFIKPEFRLLLISAILAIPLSAIRFSPAPLLKVLTDSILIKKDQQSLVLLSLAIVGIFLLNLPLRFGQAYLARLANERIMRDIREKLFSHYMDLSSSFFTEASVGKLVSRVTNDVFYVSQGTINLIALFRDVLTFVGLFIYAITLNAKLLLLTLVIAPFLTWLGKRSGTLMKGYAFKMQDANGGVYAALQEAFSGFKVIKAFGMERLAFSRFKFKNDEYVNYALKGARVEELGGPSVEVMGAIAAAIVIFVGGNDVIHGRISSGDLIAFFTSFFLMVNPIRNLNDSNMKLNLAGASADRINETLSLRSEIIESSSPLELQAFSKSIEFQNVSFRYGVEQPWIFQNINFSIPKGKSLALVGASGQGKSTLINLVPRFYDPSVGNILIDGSNLKDFSLKSIRDHVSLVTQDVFLFNDTIYNNVAAGSKNATKQEVLSALEMAYAMPFIQKFPQGLETVVGDRGQKLSGGERQRVSIARAILKNAPILLLDEATSSLDSESERLVQKALEKLMQGRTTLVIAHRLSTIKNVDEILVFSGGKVVESGTHDELMSKTGEYARFYSLLS